MASASVGAFFILERKTMDTLIVLWYNIYATLFKIIKMRNVNKKDVQEVRYCKKRTLCFVILLYVFLRISTV